MTMELEKDAYSSDEEIGSEEIEDNLLKIGDDNPLTESIDDGLNCPNWTLELEAEQKAGEPVNQSALTLQSSLANISAGSYQKCQECHASAWTSIVTNISDHMCHII